MEGELTNSPAHRCAACRVPLTIPPRYRAAHVLCPSCQGQHAATVARVPRANPYPVVTANSTVAYRYSQLAAPSVSESPAPTPTPGGQALTGRVCVRFGCGARLPVHALKNMCEACVDAGFHVLRGSTAERQRAIDHARPRPRESLEFVRASLMREAALSATAAMEKKDMKIKLVYPNDTHVETPRGFNTPRNESRLVEDQDAELELVYPEDVVEATPTLVLPSKLLSKTLAPTLLREPLTDGLQTRAIPSTNSRKRRKLAAVDNSDSSQCPSIISLTTATNMEEIVSDEPDVPPLTLSSGESSGGGQSSDHSVGPTPACDSDLSELTDSEPGSASDSDSDFVPDIVIPNGEDTTGLTIRIPPLINRLPPDDQLRKCGNKRCNIAVPKDHRWKTCDPCRRAQRLYQRRRLENIRRGILGYEILSPNLCRRWRSLSPDLYETETEMCLTPETSRPCAVRHCRRRVPLPEIYRWKTCTGCRARARRDARRKRDERLARQQAPVCRRDVSLRAYQNRGALLASFGAQLRGFVDGLIVYLSAKLGECGGRGKDGGGEVWKPEHAKMIFVFLGEYSVVAGQRGDSDLDLDDGDGDIKDKDKDTDDHAHDDPTELETMRQEVSSVVLDLERVLDARFRPGEAFALDKGGMIMRFTCSLELVTQLHPIGFGSQDASCRPDSRAHMRRGEGDTDTDEDTPTPTSPPNPPAVPLAKTLSGELEAVVIPDGSHTLLHGQRTVIRYRMFG